MTWPTGAVPTTNVDATTDDPELAVVDIKSAFDKLNQIIAHVSTFAATMFDDADAAAVRATLGAASSASPTFSGTVSLSTAISKIVPGATSLSLRNNADSADNWILTDAGNGTLRGNLVVSGVGPHAIGGAVDTNAQFSLKGTFVDVGGPVRGLELSSTFNPAANQSGRGINLGPTINKAGSGTHADFTTLEVQPPAIGAGAAALTNATTLKITGAPSVGTNKRALWVLDGLVEFGGGQIKFPATQNPSSDANTLDDYEEGTWTPSLGGTATYSVQSGTYTKIGRLVFIECSLSVATIGTGSTTTIGGLPFAPILGTSAYADVAGSVTAIVSATATLNTGSTITIQSRTAASASAALNAIFQNGASVSVAGFYRV